MFILAGEAFPDPHSRARKGAQMAVRFLPRLAAFLCAVPRRASKAPCAERDIASSRHNVAKSASWGGVFSSCRGASPMSDLGRYICSESLPFGRYHAIITVCEASERFVATWKCSCGAECEAPADTPIIAGAFEQTRNSFMAHCEAARH